MSQKNLEQTAEEIYMKITNEILKNNMKNKLAAIKKSKEPESFYEKIQSMVNKRTQQYKTQILYAGIFTGLAAATVTAGTLYYFLAN